MMIDTFEIKLIAVDTIVNLLSEELEEEIRFRGNFCKLPSSWTTWSESNQHYKTEEQ
jgi:hypothetical protein